jgi:hypothetical protein
MTVQQVLDSNDKPPFRPLRLVAVVLVIMLGISSAAQWYSSNITLPRYCEDPVGVLTHVRQLLTETHPAGDEDRKPYIIAARLTFLIPQESEEPLTIYINRLRGHIEQQCR